MEIPDAMIENVSEKYEVGIVLRIPDSAEISNYKFPVSTRDKKAAIMEALVQLKTAVISEKRVTSFIQIIFPMNYEFKIDSPLDKKFGVNARYELNFKISARNVENAVDGAIKFVSTTSTIENTDTMFQYRLNRMAGKNDKMWTYGEERKLTPDEEKELNEIGDELKANFIKSLEKSK